MHIIYLIFLIGSIKACVLTKVMTVKIRYSVNIILSPPTLGLKEAKNTKNAFFACFRPYIQQSDNHIG